MNIEQCAHDLALLKIKIMLEDGKITFDDNKTIVSTYQEQFDNIIELFQN